jgi:hypothetical protein
MLWKQNSPLLANFGVLNTKMTLKFAGWLSFSDYRHGIKLRVFFALWVTPLDKSRQQCSIVALQSYHVISHCNRLVLHHVISSCHLKHDFSCYVVFSELGQEVVICSKSEFLEITLFCVIIFVV